MIDTLVVDSQVELFAQVCNRLAKKHTAALRFKSTGGGSVVKKGETGEGINCDHVIKFQTLSSFDPVILTNFDTFVSILSDLRELYLLFVSM